MTTPPQDTTVPQKPRKRNSWLTLQDSAGFVDRQQIRGRNSWLVLQDAAGFKVEEDEENIRNPLVSLFAGLTRGLTEPLTIVPAVNDIADKLKPYYGDNWTSKVAYGLGFIGGSLFPGSLLFKVGGKVARGVGFIVKTGDKAGDLSRVGKLTRGAVTGALYGAGMHAGNPRDYAKQVLMLGTIGGAGELVIPKLMSAFSARFGNNLNAEMRNLVEESIKDQGIVTARSPVSTGVRKGVAIHARAMQLVEDMDNLFFTSEQRQYFQALRDRGINAPEMALSPSAGRRLAMDYNVEQLNFTDLIPGQYRIVPTPHQDANVFQKLLNRLENVSHQKITRPDGEFVVVGLSEGFDRAVVKELEKFGYMRGQELIYSGHKWIALGPGKKEGSVRIAKVGRNKKPHTINIKEAAFLPIAHDITKPSMAKIQPLVAEFLEDVGLWPEKGDFADAVKDFVTRKGMNTSEQLAFRRDLITKQRNALGKHDPELGQLLKNLDEVAEQTNTTPHPDGPMDELAAARGVIVRQVWDDGGYKYRASDSSGQTLTTSLRSSEEMTEWLHAYQVEPQNLAPNGMIIADEVVPGSGTPSMKSHTAIDHSGDKAIDVSSAHFNPLLSFTRAIIPRVKFLQFAEDKLIQLGITDIRPYTDFFIPLSQKRKMYLNEQSIWVKGGRLDDGTKIRGLVEIYNPKKPNIRASQKENIVDLLEAPRSQWSKIAAEKGLNEKELKAAGEMRKWFNDMFERYVKDPEINISGDDFIENYWPHFRRLSDEDAVPTAVKAFGELFPGKKINKPTMRFISEMQRQGIMSKYERDPFNVMLKYLRGGLYKSHMRETMDNAVEQVNKLGAMEMSGEFSEDLGLVFRSMQEYLSLARYGAPEAFVSVNAGINNILRNLNVKLDRKTHERIINTYLTLNYGAYLGFRPGLAVRNMYQVVLTVLPIVGPKYLAYGLKAVFSNKQAGWDKARKAGALLTDHVPVFGDDLLYAEWQSANYIASSGVKGSGGGKIKDPLEWLNKKAQAATNLGMKLYTSADKINRGVAFWAMRKRAMDSWNKYGSKGEMDKFFSKSGINFFGPAVKQEFRKIQRSAGAEAAVDWIGARAAEDTQWIYQLGAGPSMFSGGIGRLFGQYGTWPSWYTAYLAQGMKNLKGVERASFLAYTVAVNKGVIMAGGAAGYNLSRWTGISSLTWMGGPAVDWFSDFRAIATGLTATGESTGSRSIALSKIGVRDIGGNGAPFLPAFAGGRLQFHEDPEKRMKFLTYFLSMVTPGYLMYQDVKDATKQDNPIDIMGRLMSIPLNPPGYSYPQSRLSK